MALPSIVVVPALKRRRPARSRMDDGVRVLQIEPLVEPVPTTAKRRPFTAPRVEPPPEQESERQRTRKQVER